MRPPTKNAVLTTWIAENYAIPAGEMNLFANIICGRVRLSADPDLIARKGSPPAFKQDWVPSGQHFRKPLLERSISVQDFWARSVCAENGTPRLDRARHNALLERCKERGWWLLESRH